ncbi:thymidylate synthase [Leuconostoc mesenteroides]|mgnify:FL=1|uniref:Thymidylate synthase n=1 Tax=Leuconostoc mesenteroides subsp. cremoris ATCC 19254 TaxID=586220 RepID=C2KLG7_LEUMC|nr:thymidylate synthase [Leuconostoc mesenteroides]EQC84209.1 thymidylate synthase [Leuconostoc mesenteroides subsp. cremoris TIFN8]KDA51742.1 Thymidylate synthase [Leuconostoc mesenteroides subsp. cremoris T26]EEJ41921.1 thymidylate synthase [Leuconostoc mesenteroides subsp. cremoris ATCC 19254]MDG9750831.1 thymidylate synthase [Leuconostoc mesenteroides]ORI35604.1 thymidylate synthase [Leuconostoc mesenteroides subsp. cremoris]
MSQNEQQYLDLAQNILDEGSHKGDRTGTGTRSLFGTQMRFNLAEGFPLLTTKKVFFGLIKSELLWFLRGDNNIRFLLEHNNHIWDEWAFKKWIESDKYTGPDMTNFGLRSQTDENFAKIYKEQKDIFVNNILNDDEFKEEFGYIGNVYGKLWRSWETNSLTAGDETVDQVARLIDQIKETPNSRRLILTAWNAETTPQAPLPSCHVLSQFYVADGKLSLQMYQRSGDFFLGVPFNIASYSLLLHMVAAQTGYEVGEFIHTIGDTHIYNNHVDQITEQLSRPMHKLPKLWLNPEVKSLFDYTMDDIKILDYDSEPAIKAPVAV